MPHDPPPSDGQNFVQKFAEIIAANRQGSGEAIVSVCSAQEDVLRAAMRGAAAAGEPLLIEATSNQVNQYGGYTGMKPADFIRFVNGLAAQEGIDRKKIYFGGDHLGPQAWRHEPADQAMAKAEQLVADYVAAGFRKIHLDCSEGCAGEPAAVGDRLAAERAARLAAVCEKTAAKIASASPDLVYVIGTEVPPPGGARIEDAASHCGDHALAGGVAPVIPPTAPENAAATLAAHQREFARAGLADTAWRRVVGLVVQPGVEFAIDQIHRYEFTPYFAAASTPLAAVLAPYPGLAFEAHSTDYQSAAALAALKNHHFAVLKVGPGLTFAYRTALYALDEFAQDNQYVKADAPSLRQVMEQLMQDDPTHWRKHYPASAPLLSHWLHYSYADRIRYYWPHPRAQQAVANLFAALPTKPPRDVELLPYFSADILARADGLRAAGKPWHRALVFAQIGQVLSSYYGTAW
ncbi:MAG: class II D-tagatose-bisphosphate aldolase, non-catalytic subunit [Candidatus Symbiobacter sp.]|nr:class II D-tagatose-bisphosphate aldolase, non-catalytic subunit [Candidatus Symbiobacter sp.]